MGAFPKICRNFVPDEGYYFGLGVFETMLFKKGSIELQELHIRRITESACSLGMIAGDERELCAWGIEEQLEAFLDEQEEIADNTVVKMAWSGERLFCSLRPNAYTKDQYEKGFHLEFSPVLRNETSLFTYHKTLNYGDNILEKRRAHREGFDEPLFLNARGQVAEGATTNIFYVTGDGIFTPPVADGLLNGTVRQHLLQEVREIRERSVLPEELMNVREIFVTNALLGIMPVSRLGEKVYGIHEVARELRERFFA